MPTRLEIHPTAKTAAYALGCSLAVVLLLTGFKRLAHNHPPATAPSITAPAETAALYLPASLSNPLVPVVELSVADASMETNWSAALAVRLSGKTEFPIEGGRVDVLTSDYAIEVDHLDKWHEGIGQAAHYAMITKTIPVVALIVPSGKWPLSDRTRAKLLLIDDTCRTQNIKLILLRRVD